MALPDRNEKHTIPTDKYLMNRLSSGAVEQARHHGCEFFCGSGRDEMLNHYAHRGFDRAISISSNTSTKFDLLSNSSNGKSLLVLSGMSSTTRIKHQLLQLHFADVDLNRVKLVGDINLLKEKSGDDLRKELSQLPPIPSKTLFIGDLPPTNRASRSLVKFVFGEEDEHEEALYGTANHRVSEGSRGRYAGQGTVQEAWVQ
ncbi:IS1404 transposase [Burkholderia mallei FMH]|nr:IS1404 transposase [Burkholderia mallei FMH]